MLKFLVALTCCFGCGDELRGEGGGRLYTFKLPTEVNPQSVAGLEIILQADSLAATESYYIDFFAVRPAKDSQGKPQLLPLGGQDVFKPLKKGETTTVYLNAPSRDAWLQGKTGEELKLQFQIMPAAPKREKPDVTLRIVDVKATTAK